MNDILELAQAGKAEELWIETRDRALDSLYYFNKVVLGYRDLSAHLHLEVCEHIERQKSRRQVYKLPRAHFKSTLAKGYALYRWVKEKVRNKREIAILFTRETDDLAHESLREIRGHLESNQILKWLFPELFPFKATQDEIIFPREVPRGEACITAKGYDVAKTGPHYDLVIKDDIVGFNASTSDTEMKKAIEWHQYSEGLFVTPGVEEGEDLLFGTNWNDKDLYAWIEENEPDYEIYVRSAIENGEPLFPERFTMATLQRIRAKQGEYKFSCQYLNDPVPPEGGDFKAEHLQEYSVRDNRFIKLPELEEVPESLDRVGYFDPRHLEDGFKGSCEHALVMVGMDTSFRRIVLETWSKQCGVREALHEAQKLNDRWMGRWFYEAVGAQRWLGAILMEIQKDAACQFRLKLEDPVCGKSHRRLVMHPNPVKTRVHKDDRIRGEIQPVVEEGKLFLKAGQDKLRNQLLRFPFGKLKDLIDALAGALPLLLRPRSDFEEAEERSKQEEATVSMQSYTNTEFFCG